MNFLSVFKQSRNTDAKGAAWSWDAMLAEFRALGGIAQNIVLRSGQHGRGLFAIDPAEPVRLHVPLNLLIRCDDTEVRQGRLVIRETARMGQAERAFFDRYQQNFSWGAGVFTQLQQAQAEWHQLPQTFQNALRRICPDTGGCFSEPNDDLCHKRYLTTRRIMHFGTHVLMPVAELLNHGNAAAGFNFQDGVSVEGIFRDEVLADYGDGDCWGTAIRHGFYAPCNRAHSFAMTFKYEDFLIEISRKAAEQPGGRAMPAVHVEGDIIRFSSLTLGDIGAPGQPRAIFDHIARGLPLKQPDQLFAYIQHVNRLLLIDFLRNSEACALPLAGTLRHAAYRQLETLSHHWANPPIAHAEQS